MFEACFDGFEAGFEVRCLRFVLKGLRLVSGV